MLNIALTGNIAAGKSTVVDLFRKWGATMIDADVLAREAQAPGSAVLAAIAGRFGADVLARGGGLDRAALRGKVMGDDAALAALNAIVHPAVQQRRLELQRAAQERGDAIVINDIPLLFEVLDPAQFDAVVLIDAPAPLRRTRLRTLRGLSNEEADRMIAAQMPAERKRPQSHHVIDNSGTLAELQQRAQDVFAELRRQAARAGVRNEEPGQTLVLCAIDAKDAAAPVLKAIARRYTDAGMRIEQTTAKTLGKTLKSITPLSIVATAAAAEGARAAWDRAVPPRPCRLYHLSPDPDPIAVRLDLRPWGHDRVSLSEEDGAGLAPRADLV
ncbi:MAG: dephospho-CoA kinase [Gemmatimonadetes bacterium 13_1_20CM_4_66_11]|nr:MAG: dephospho-CoA kinase [Gemmatimonadetes bacterium 13_1_20CM_4_66_11]